jgi:hypothetical protein
VNPDAAGVVHAQQADAVKILIDSPSLNPALGFGSTAEALAQIIRDSPARFAVGIFGDWGSGKTTLMDEIRHRLGTAVISVDFNAWRYEREPQLLIPLLDTIRGALVAWSAGRDADTRERIRAAARKVARIIRGLAAGLSADVGVPGAAKVSYDVGKSIEALTLSGEPEQPQSLYVAAFEELSQAFAELSAHGITKIVVFVDDLDRCLPDNALDVIESMKLFFDLPGFVFVVGLDEKVVQRAVRTRFPEASGSGPATADPSPRGKVTPEAQLARDYVEKIFQVPYRLPPMVAEQLNELLAAMYNEAELPAAQLNDFRDRVTRYLQHVAVRGQINPREVKRFLNTYTLQMLVRPGLDRNIVLALQTLVFRYDWRVLYDAILTDTLLFSDALTRFRDGDDRAFEDLSPDLTAVQEELASCLRSDAFAALATVGSLDPYLTSLESTGGTQPWLGIAYKEIGRLRLEVRRLRAIQSPTESDRLALSSFAADVASMLESNITPGVPGYPASFPALLQEIRGAVEPIPMTTPSETTSAALPSPIAEPLARLEDVATRIYRELRVARSALAPIPHT